jgi:hypothetical protein
MNEEWAMFEELGSRVMADLLAENSRVVGLSAVTSRALKAEGRKVTGFKNLKGLYFGLQQDDWSDDWSDDDKREWKLEEQRVYEVMEVQGDGRLVAAIVWPETKDEDPKAGTEWYIRPDLVDWVYDPKGNSRPADVAPWRDEWDALKESTKMRWPEITL